VNNCLQCKKNISNPKFCSNSCAASYNNKKRVIDHNKRQEINKKISHSMINYKHNIENKTNWYKPLYKYSKLFINTCFHCNIKTVHRQKKKYCNKCSILYKSDNRNKYRFTFNVFDYPLLFDLQLINKLGFYAPSGKSGNWNPNGVSRDHKVSVNESIKNEYDPYYITHPLNCDIIPHHENNKKKTKSSISYQNLVKLVNAYDTQITCSTN